MEQCIICMDSFSEDRTAHTLSCGHSFHVDCILNWAQSDNESHGSCPICRVSTEIDSPYQLQTSFSWQTLQDRRKCKALIQIVKDSCGHMCPDEQKLLAFLVKHYDRIEQRIARHAEESRNFNKTHGHIIRRYRSLQAQRYKLRTLRVNHIRDILQMFSVVTVIKSRPDKPPVVVRRSERLEAQARNQATHVSAGAPSQT